MALAAVLFYRGFDFKAVFVDPGVQGRPGDTQQSGGPRTVAAREVQRLVFESLSREQVRSLSGSMSAIASALDPQLASELKQRMDAIGQ